MDPMTTGPKIRSRFARIKEIFHTHRTVAQRVIWFTKMRFKLFFTDTHVAQCAMLHGFFIADSANFAVVAMVDLFVGVVIVKNAFRTEIFAENDFAVYTLIGDFLEGLTGLAGYLSG